MSSSGRRPVRCFGEYLRTRLHAGAPSPGAGTPTGSAFSSWQPVPPSMPTLMAAPRLRAPLPPVWSRRLPAGPPPGRCPSSHVIGVCVRVTVRVFKDHRGCVRPCRGAHLGGPRYFPQDQLFVWGFCLQRCGGFACSPPDLLCSVISVVFSADICPKDLF